MAGFHTKTFLKHDSYMTPKSAWDNIKHLIPKDKVIWFGSRNYHPHLNIYEFYKR